jgi:hypothetical protein
MPQLTPKKGRPATRGDAKTTSLILAQRHREIALRAAGHTKPGAIAQGIRAALEHWAVQNQALGEKVAG